MAKTKVTLINLAAGLVFQICTVASGFIIPKIILYNFGSSANGLIASLSQFINYIALIEGGITSVVTANLYKPIVDNNNSQISSILVTARKFYRKIAAIFVLYSLVLSVAYPLLKDTEFSFEYVASLSIIISIGVFIQYMFSLTLKTLLDADKKSYIVSFTQSTIIILNILLAIICVKFFPSVHLLKLITALLFVLQPIVYNTYVRKHYDINWKTASNNNLIKERWDGFAINTAAFIHNSTDIAVLTFFTDLKTVSIYSVYALVTNGLKQLLNSLFAGINPVIGQAYAKYDQDDLNMKLDVYEYIVLLFVFFTYTISALMITPFVLLYTNGVTDTNYNHVIFGILLSISEAVYLIKAPHLGLAYAANQFKKISIPAYIEAIINIVISVVLVHFYGLIGIAIGTIAGMLYRMAFHVSFTSRIVKNRNQLCFYKKLGLFMLTTGIGVIICNSIPTVSNSVITWVQNTMLNSVILFLLYGGLSVIVFRKELQFITNYLRKK